MYTKFTDRARRVMQYANKEAQRFRHEYIGTAEILLGLVKEREGTFAPVLENLKVDLDTIRVEVEKRIPPNADGSDMPTPRAKKVIEYAMEEAEAFNHNYVGTEHMLLGLLREKDCLAAEVLMELGVTLEVAREEVVRLLGIPPEQQQ